MERTYIRGVGVYPFNNPDQLIEYADANKGILVAINAEKVLWATDETRHLINHSIGYCDGSGVVAALKKKGIKNVVKMPGCELWLEILKKYSGSKTFYIIGATPEVHEKVISRLYKDFPDIKILGHRDGYLKNDAERQSLIDDVATKKPDVVFVAMGSPKQELLMGEMYAKHKAIYQGLGGSFDVYSGAKSRAPKWVLKMNLEFMHRLFIEPKRIFKHVYLIKYAWWLTTNKL